LTPEPQTGLAIALNILLGVVVYGACLLALFPPLRNALASRLSDRFA